MSEMKLGRQWNTPGPVCAPTSLRNLDCSVICPLSSWEPDALEILSLRSLMRNWLHFPQAPGIGTENKTSAGTSTQRFS
jgi:hypothetical protein